MKKMNVVQKILDKMGRKMDGNEYDKFIEVVKNSECGKLTQKKVKEIIRPYVKMGIGTKSIAINIKNEWIINMIAKYVTKRIRKEGVKVIRRIRKEGVKVIRRIRKKGVKVIRRRRRKASL